MSSFKNAFRAGLSYIGLTDPEPRDGASGANGHAYDTEQLHLKQENSSAIVTSINSFAPRANTLFSGKIMEITPLTYDSSCKAIAEAFRLGNPVCMNLAEVGNVEARRILDFSSGLVQGLQGSVKRVGAGVFLLMPSSVDLVRIAEDGADESQVDDFAGADVHNGTPVS